MINDDEGSYSYSDRTVSVSSNDDDAYDRMLPAPSSTFCFCIKTRKKPIDFSKVMK